MHDLMEVSEHMNESLKELAKRHILTLKELRAEKWARAHKWKLVEYVVASLYTLGSVIFVVGSVFFIPAVEEVTPPDIGTWLFIVGSLIFMGGAILNMIQLYTVTSPLSVQLLNATAVQFLLGSTCYLVGSVVYLLPWGSDEAWRVAGDLAAWLFVIGSCLFFTGGAVNWIRIRSSRAAHEKLGGAAAVMATKQSLKFHVHELLLEHRHHHDGLNDDHDGKGATTI